MGACGWGIMVAFFLDETPPTTRPQRRRRRRRRRAPLLQWRTTQLPFTLNRTAILNTLQLAIQQHDELLEAGYLDNGLFGYISSRHTPPPTTRSPSTTARR